MRQPQHNPQNTPLPLLAARRRSLRKKHRSGRVAKLPRTLKKQLKQAYARGWNPRDVRIERYAWETVQVEYGQWESNKEVGLHIPKTYGNPARRGRRRPVPKK